MSDPTAPFSAPPRSGVLFVLSGTSGAGKDTLLARVLATTPEVSRCVTFTTRAPRPGEVEGVDYQFVSRERFAAMRDAAELLEWAEVYGNGYGNSAAWVKSRLAAGFSVVLRIDVQGALTLRGWAGENPEVPVALLFVAAPSREELERRLRTRATEDEATLARRLAAADWETAQLPAFDYLIVNDDPDAATDLIRCVIRAEHARIRPHPH